MSTPSALSSTASVSLAFLALSSQQRQVVTRCVVNYSHKESGFNAEIKHTLYICLEMLRALFGRSDWQQAQSALSSKTVSVLPTYCVSYLGKRNIKQLSEGSLHAILYLNGCTYRLPSGVERFVATKCNVDTLSQAVGRWVDKRMQQVTNQMELQAQKTACILLDKCVQQCFAGRTSFPMACL